MFLGGPKFWGWSSFTKFSVDPPPKKVIAPIWSTFSEFSVALKKKGHRANLVCFSLSSLLIFKKKRAKLVYLSPSSLLVSKNKKRSSFQFSQLFSEFSVDLQKKKKGYRAKLVYLSLSSLLVSKTKSHHLQTAARKRGV